MLGLEHRDLLSDLRSLPRNSLVRKINELVKRAKMSKVHACILGHLTKAYGFFTSKESKQRDQLKNLLNEFKVVQTEYGLPQGDFPNVNKFRATLQNLKIWQFPNLDQKSLAEMDHVLAYDIPRLLRNIPGCMRLVSV